MALATVILAAAASPVDLGYLRYIDGTLASDTFQGRRVGEPGGKLAHDFLQHQLDQLGLKPFTDFPAATAPFDVTRGLTVDGTPTLSITAEHPVDAAYPAGFDAAPYSGSGSADAPLVFAGYGIA